MSKTNRESKPGVPAPTSTIDSDAKSNNSASKAANRPKEIGGRDGPDPTRYGDWEKNGRCIDF